MIVISLKENHLKYFEKCAPFGGVPSPPVALAVAKVGEIQASRGIPLYTKKIVNKVIQLYACGRL